MAARVSDKPWSSFSQADYTPDQWARACLIDTGDGDPASKERYKLPVREPNGDLNRNAVHAAAGGHGIGAVRGVSAMMKQAAAKKLAAMYREMDEDPPDSVLTMAGMMRGAQEDVMSGERQYRSFMPDLQVRSGGDGRTIHGIVVPWRAPTRITDALVEQFAEGAFDHQFRSPQRVKFAREHLPLGGTLIGAATTMRNDAAGLYMELRTSRTPVGEETLELVKDGALNELSVGFHERTNRRLAGGITERVKADLFEVAVVMEGAYGQLAAIGGVRSAQQPGRTLDDLDVDLRAKAEQYLVAGGLPPLPDRDLELRRLRLGLRL